MSKKHNSNRLILARRILTLLAVVLFCVTLFSGYLYFFEARNAPAAAGDPLPPVSESFPAEATETVAPTMQPFPTEPTAAEVPSTEVPGETLEIVENTGTVNAIPSSSSAAESAPDETEATTATEAPTVPATTMQTEATLETEDSASDELSETLADLPSRVPDEAAPVPVMTDQPGPASSLWGLIFLCSTGLLVTDLIALLFVNRKIHQERLAPKPELFQAIPRTTLSGGIPGRRALTIGTLHQPGRRQYQQDSLGHSIVLDGRGVLAVVADGMGGLADGDKVSQQIVLRTLELGARLQGDQANGALYRILNQVNENINQMLTPEGLYKCGSTMIAVLVQGMSFQWISVGDSRIYLYREGYVNCLNRDHDLLQDWMPEILSGQRSMETSLADPNARKLTSFIGMGRLKYVDGSIQPIELLPGDRLLLLSDGVYGEVSEAQMAAILKQHPDVRQAATALGQQVQANQNPHQDNYTALILGF